MAGRIVRLVARVVSGAAGALGVYLLYLGATGLYAAAVFVPWPWRPPMGVAALGGLAFGGLMGAGGVVLTGLGGALLAAGWLGLGLPRPRWPRRRAPGVHAA